MAPPWVGTVAPAIPVCSPTSRETSGGFRPTQNLVTATVRCEGGVERGVVAVVVMAVEARAPYGVSGSSEVTLGSHRLDRVSMMIRPVSATGKGTTSGRMKPIGTKIPAATMIVQPRARM
jgi:hypothetical protein